MTKTELWEKYKRWLVDCDATVGLRVDISRMNFPEGFFDEHRRVIDDALEQMKMLEQGAVANPDENRQVGHYWLRNPDIAPSEQIRNEIEQTVERIEQFAKDVHGGGIRPPHAERFRHILHIGIGGSALGPQLADSWLSNPGDPMDIYFLDNTDPDGIRRTLDTLGSDALRETLVVVVSKSGGTKETRNAMLETKAAFERAALAFAPQAVAITQQGSALYELARGEEWLETFPMWSWVGGRTSELSAVGLVPAALQGFPIRELLDGARDCDEVTRRSDAKQNPAMVLALMWLYAQSGPAPRNMVVLPYRDRLALFSRYLQQLVMESLGKSRNLQGKVVSEGLTVFGNKGSTDQHAYVQQLREGRNDFFVTFIQVLQDGPAEQIEPGVTTGDFLHGFLLGTRDALYENGRESMTITVRDASARSLGVLIALFERAVGYYASLVGINAYHQPGVEAGKKAAGNVLSLQTRVMSLLKENSGQFMTAQQMAEQLNERQQVEWVFHLLEHLAARPDKPIRRIQGDSLFDTRYGIET